MSTIMPASARTAALLSHASCREPGVLMRQMASSVIDKGGTNHGESC